MALVLAFDTSAGTASVALHDESRGRYFEAETSAQSHDEELLLIVASLLAKADAAASDIGRLVVGTGPGSFTGLRIGYSYAKGLAAALAIPVTAVSSLLATAHAALREGAAGSAEGARLLVVEDARRGEFFSAVYRLDAGRLSEDAAVAIRTVAELEPFLASRVVSRSDPSLLRAIDPALPGRVVRPGSVARSLIELHHAGEGRTTAPTTHELAELAPHYLRGAAAKTIAERSSVQRDRSVRTS